VSAPPVVALLSDFGADSFYVGVMKSALLAAAPDAQLIDLTHAVPAHAVAQGSYVLSLASRYFPKGAVFLAVVDPGVGSSRRAMVAERAGRFFVAPDNGLLTEAAPPASSRYHALDEARLARFRAHAREGDTFHGRDVFAPAAGALAAGTPLAEIAAPAADPATLPALPALALGPRHVRGFGRYVDAFGNVLTNIPAAEAARALGAPLARVRARAGNEDLGAVGTFYAEQPAGELMAIANSWGMIEIAANEGRAIDRFGGAPPEGIAVELEAAP